MQTTLAPTSLPDWFIPPENSLIDYEASIETWVSSNVAIHKPLGSPVSSSGTDAASSAAAQSKMQPLERQTDTAGYKLAPVQGSVPAAIVQNPTAGTIIVRLSGNAVRAGYRITPPTLVSFAGQVPTLLNAYVKEMQIGDVGVPIYGLIWAIDYQITTGADNRTPPVSPNQILNGLPDPGSFT